MRERPRGVKPLLFTLFLWVGLPILALALVEGLASLVLLARGLSRRTGAVAEKRHTRYDSQLGWVNVPNLVVRDHYGPGLSLSINAQGFRATRDVTRQRPAGKRRVVCSGDSFTLGYGVGDEDPWCARLASLEPTIEAVNMGQGGYGLDQAYLWYKRDGVPLEHDALVFAIITDDFRRMGLGDFLGYGKPRLALREGRLVTENVPVPRSRRYVPRLNERIDAVRQLRLLRLFDAAWRRVARPEPPETGAWHSETWAVTTAILADLETINRAKGSALVVAYLPARWDYLGRTSDPWRARLQRLAGEQGLVFVDLVSVLRGVPADQVERMFIAEGELAFVGASGHLTAAGNRWVAEQVLPVIRQTMIASSR